MGMPPVAAMPLAAAGEGRCGGMARDTSAYGPASPQHTARPSACMAADELGNRQASPRSPHCPPPSLRPLSLGAVRASTDAPATTARPAVPAAAPADKWTEHTAPDGRTYYYNAAKGQSLWEKPPELAAAEAAAKVAAAAAAAAKPAAAAPAAGAAADAAGGWKEYTSPDGRKYYYNKNTKTVRARAAGGGGGAVRRRADKRGAAAHFLPPPPPRPPRPHPCPCCCRALQSVWTMPEELKRALAAQQSPSKAAAGSPAPAAAAKAPAALNGAPEFKPKLVRAQECAPPPAPPPCCAASFSIN